MDKNFNNKKDHYSIRKLTVGAASVLIGCTWMGLSSQTVHASTLPISTEQSNDVTKKDEPSKVSAEADKKAQEGQTVPEVKLREAQAPKQGDVVAKSKAIETTKSEIKNPTTTPNSSDENKPETKEQLVNLKSNKKSAVKEDGSKTPAKKEVKENSNYDINQWNYTEDTDKTNITLTGLKDDSAIKDGTVYIPNTYDFKQKEELKDIQKVIVTPDLIKHLADKANNLVIDKKTDDQGTGQKVYASAGDWSNAFRDVTNPYRNAHWKKLDLSNLDTSAITNMHNMFYTEDSLTEVGDLSGWDTSHVTDMTGLFQETAIKNLNLDNWNFKGLTTSGRILTLPSGITTLSAKNWKFGPNNANLSYLFGSDLNLESIDITNWQGTENIQNLSRMFSGDTKLTTIKGLNTLYLPNVTDLSYAFDQTGLDTIDLSGAGLKKIQNLSYTFWNMNNLTTANLSGWDVSHVTNLSYLFNRDSKLTNIIGLKDWKLSSLPVSFAAQDAFTYLKFTAGSPTPSGASIFENFEPTVLNDSVSWFLKNNPMIDLFSPMDTNTGELSAQLLRVYLNKLDKSSTTSIDVSGWNTGAISNFSNMFKDFNKLTEIKGLENWDVSNGTNFSGMFENDTALNNLDGISNWNTSKATDLSYMFAAIINHTQDSERPKPFTPNGSLKQLNLSNWNTNNVTNMAGMFEGQQNLTSVGNLSTWNTSKVNNMSHLFAQCKKLNWDGNLNLSSWDTSKVTNMSYLFAQNNQAKDLSFIDGWKTGNVKDMSYMFFQDPKLEKIGDLSGWNTSQVGTASGLNYSLAMMFAGDYNLKDLSGLDAWKDKVGNVTDTRGMFLGTESLHSINLSGWKTPKLTIAGEMFQNSGAKDINLNNWDFSKVARYNEYGTHNSSAGELVYSGVSDIFKDLQNPATIHLENIKLPTIKNNQFSIIDFAGTKPIVVFMNGQESGNTTFENLRYLLNGTGWPIFIESPDADPNEYVIGRQNSDYLTLYDKNDPNKVLATIPLNFVFKDQNEFNNYLATKVSKTNIDKVLDHDNVEYHKAKNWYSSADTYTDNTQSFLEYDKTREPQQSLSNTMLLALTPSQVSALTGGNLPIVLIDGKYYLTFTPEESSVKQKIIFRNKDTNNDLLITDISITTENGIGTVDSQTINKVIDDAMQNRLKNYDYVSGKLEQNEKLSGTQIESNPIIVYVKEKSVPVVPTTHEENEVKEITRTIITTHPNGSQTKQIQTVTFTRTNTLNSNGNLISSTPWQPQDGSFNEVEVAQIDGYTSLVDGVEATDVAQMSVTPDTNNVVVNVTYQRIKNQKPHNDKPNNENDHKHNNSYDINTRPQNEDLSNKSNGKDKVWKLKGFRSQAAYNEYLAHRRTAKSNERQVVNGRNNKTLPQTSSNNSVAIVGAAIASASALFGLAAGKKRKN